MSSGISDEIESIPPMYIYFLCEFGRRCQIKNIFSSIFLRFISKVKADSTRGKSSKDLHEADVLFNIQIPYVILWIVWPLTTIICYIRNSFQALVVYLIV